MIYGAGSESDVPIVRRGLPEGLLWPDFVRITPQSMMSTSSHKPGASPAGPKKGPVITAKEFEEIFGRMGDFASYVDKPSAQPSAMPAGEPLPVQGENRKVTIDFPEWVVDGLEAESQLIGVSKQAIVKMWIAEKLQKRQGRSRLDRD